MRTAVQSPYEPSRNISLALVGALTLLAAALRLPTLGVQSFWIDEAATWDQVNGSLVDVIVRTAADNYPPLFNLLAWGSLQLFGDAEWALRLPAALLGIATVPMLYVLGARIGGRSTGLIAALLLTLSGFHVWYSQEARMYSLLALAATAHAWAMLRYLELQVKPRATMLVATGAALLFSHPFGTLTWIAIALGAYLTSPRPAAGAQLKKLLRLEGLTLAIFALWGLALLWRAIRIADGGFWVPPPTPEYVWEELALLTGGLGLPLLAIAALGLAPRRGAAANPALPLLWLWLLLPGIIGLLASLLVEPIFLARYLIGSLPALFILAAYGAVRWLTAPPALIAAGVAGGAVALLSLTQASPAVRSDWRAAVASIEQTRQPQDCVIVVPTYDVRPWRYYDRTSQCVGGMSRLEEILAQNPRRLFVALEHDLPNPADAEIDTITAVLGAPTTQTFTRIEIFSFGDFGTVNAPTE